MRRALDFCMQDVRNNFPALKPDCALYAIEEKIVWQERCLGSRGFQARSYVNW